MATADVGSISADSTLYVGEAVSGQRITQSDVGSATEWDTFLAHHPWGQFQQSSHWAVAKEAEGWEYARKWVAIDGKTRGAYQLLWRRAKIGALGYISKGPVLIDPDDVAWDATFRAIRKTAQIQGLRLLWVQPPDLSSWPPDFIRAQKLAVDSLAGVIDATLLSDLSGSETDLANRLPRTTRKYLRQAAQSGVAVREGGEAELGEFFNLMLETCKRQGSKPNPGSLQSLRKIWAAFAPANAIRLTFATRDNEKLAGMICLTFGNCLTLWKKGGSVASNEHRANHALCFEALCQAQRKGYAVADFYALRRDIAQALLNGEVLTAEQNASRDRFIMGFGTLPRLLPDAVVYIPNPLLGSAYHLVSRVMRLRNSLRNK